MKGFKNLQLMIFFLLTPLILFEGCGFSPYSSKEKKDPVPEEQVRPTENVSDGLGHYQAKFITLNPQINGTLPGSANFYLKEDRLYAYVRLFAGGVNAWHPQNVFTSGRCPSPGDDLNGDGIIDIFEARKILGKVLIPLDADVGNQLAGKRFFPVADAGGTYHYERITSFKRFLQDLQAPDKNVEDEIIKLSPGEEFNFEGKTVLIQGVSENVALPDTVASEGDFRPYQTLPIACGVFTKVEGPNGLPHIEGEIPGPIAPVVDGQDRPAEEDSDDEGGEDDESDEETEEVVVETTGERGEEAPESSS